jgi:uncharacterized protein with NAD-binding domain and iron-sulfur cluster
VAILGGGMAGLAAAWRLSEPGWRKEFAAITVYQRGWRLGGKGASGRGVNGRIEEHGLHIWLGYYENAFRLLRECYAELDRDRTDPGAPIRSWRDALIPASTVGVEDCHAGRWRHWINTFHPNDLLPGDSDAPGGPMSVTSLVEKALRRLVDFVATLPGTRSHPGGVILSIDPRPPAPPSPGAGAGLGVTALAALLEAATVAHHWIGAEATALAAIDQVVEEVRRSLFQATRHDDGLRWAWHLVSVVAAIGRGLIADKVLTDPRGLDALADEDFRHWIMRHGADPEAAHSPLIGGLYDLVFAQLDGEPGRESFSAGLGIFLTSKTFFDYKGAIFWKMAAGMGDVVFAPLYQALRQRGVEFEFFHRVDALHLSDDRTAIDAVSVGVQARLADGAERYEPLMRVRGLPCFPAAPLGEQLADPQEARQRRYESYWDDATDVRRRTLRRGVDFDSLVLAIPVGMAGIICGELIADRPEWRDLVANVRTVATQAFQLWLRDDEPTLGWPQPGVTVSGYVRPFETWASMPQVIDAEDWPADDRPGAIAYFCGSLDAPWPVDHGDAAYPRRERDRVRENVLRFLGRDLAHLLPGAVRDGAFRWDLLCGRGDASGSAALDSQFWVANVDPSDRYVQSIAGSDRFRLRPDGSGYDNLFLAGDWTDCGLNAGCIEAAALSGLQAANAILGRSRRYRIGGHYLL